MSHDVEVNARTHAAAVRAAGTRVVVFPELSLTGYELDAAVVEIGDTRLTALVSACEDARALALAGAPVSDGQARSIGVLAIGAGVVQVVYRKMWLGAEEAARVAPGPAPAAIEVDGWRLGLAVCKDTGVAQHAADTAALGIDAYVAGVLENAADADVQPRRARRIVADHRVWVVIASFAGPTGGGFDRAAGGSAVWAPTGDLVASAGQEPGGLVRASLLDGTT